MLCCAPLCLIGLSPLWRCCGVIVCIHRDLLKVVAVELVWFLLWCGPGVVAVLCVRSDEGSKDLTFGVNVDS